MTNPYAPSEPVDTAASPSGTTSAFQLLGRALATAGVSIGLTLVTWVFLVQMLDRRFAIPDNLIWAATLWFSSMTSCFLVATLQRAFRPTIVCPLSFAAFSVIYILCEGPVFGDVAAGGDPSTTRTVVMNLIALPGGAFVASLLGVEFRERPKK